MHSSLVWEMIDMARVRVWESCESASASSIASYVIIAFSADVCIYVIRAHDVG